MSICPMMKSSRNKVECDPSGYFGCPKHRNRNQITPECWRLRRLEDPAKKALDQKPKYKIYRSSKLKCPKCHYKFQAKDGVMD